MIPLTHEQIGERRLELATVEEQIRALGRRKSVLRAEILSGYAAPVKGKPAEQLPLVETATATTPATQPPEAPAQAPEAAKPATATTTATPLRDRVRAALGAAKVRRSAKVLALLLGESEEDVAYELEGLELAREVIGKNTSDKAGRAYELRNRWEAKRGKDRDTKPGKASKKPAAKKPAAKKAKGAAKGKKASKAEAPAPPPAAPSPAPAPQASRQELLRKAIMDELGHGLGHGLATFGELLTTCMRDLAWTSQEMPKTTEVRDVLRALCEEGKVVWDEAKKVYHLPPPPHPEPKKKGKAEPQTAGAFLENLLASVSSTQWGQARGEICERIAQHKGRPVSVGPLLLKVGCDSNLVGAVVTLLEEAGALSITYRGKVPSTLTLSATVSDDEIAHDLQALTRRYVRGLVEDWGGDPTTADLAGNLELPAALIDSVLIELRAAQELLCDREGRWSVRSPKASAAARTAPLFADVEPAPAVDGLEPEGDET